jgi:hypothetical protein
MRRVVSFLALFHRLIRKSCVSFYSVASDILILLLRVYNLIHFFRIVILNIIFYLYITLYIYLSSSNYLLILYMNFYHFYFMILIHIVTCYLATRQIIYRFWI